MRRRFSGLRENEVLSQLSYTPTLVSILLIVKHLEPLENCENLKFQQHSRNSLLPLARTSGIVRIITTSWRDHGKARFRC